MTDNRAARFTQNRCALALVLLLPLFGVTGASAFGNFLGGPAAASEPSRGSHKTHTGIDVLEAGQFAPLRGKRIGLITNRSGMDSAGRRTIDVLARAPGIKLVALFSPEHGMEGTADERVKSGVDSATHLPVYSLYGETLRPTEEMLRGIDALVFDIQDAGVRFYTYTSTMAYALEAAASHHIAFFVLDRPNPLGGEILEGPEQDSDRLSFMTGYFSMPVRYAMTMGELAQMFNAENHIGADLHVIAMRGWERKEMYADTGLAWIAPSPNLCTLDAATLYPGVEILQAAGVSVGRGTEIPFEILGAPWIDAKALAGALQRRRIHGVKIAPAWFTPQSGLYQGVPCEGISLRVTRSRAVRSMRMGVEIASALWRMYPQNFKEEKLIVLLGSRATGDAIRDGKSPDEIVKSWNPGLRRFAAVRDKYLLYPSVR